MRMDRLCQANSSVEETLHGLDKFQCAAGANHPCKCDDEPVACIAAKCGGTIEKAAYVGRNCVTRMRVAAGIDERDHKADC